MYRLVAFSALRPSLLPQQCVYRGIQTSVMRAKQQAAPVDDWWKQNAHFTINVVDAADVPLETFGEHAYQKKEGPFGVVEEQYRMDNLVKKRRRKMNKHKHRKMKKKHRISSRNAKN